MNGWKQNLLTKRVMNVAGERSTMPLLFSTQKILMSLQITGREKDHVYYPAYPVKYYRAKGESDSAQFLFCLHALQFFVKVTRLGLVPAGPGWVRVRLITFGVNDKLRHFTAQAI